MGNQVRTRFAPSPTGPLHLGHAYSAICTFDYAQQMQGAFILRIEDLDQTRARPEWEAQIYDDLAWLGLSWETPVMRQSKRTAAYDTALDQLWDMGVLYPCTCNRKDILAAVEAPQEGGQPVVGPDGVVYPGTCRNKPRYGARPKGEALRLDSAKAFDLLNVTQLTFVEPSQNYSMDQRAFCSTIGDPILCRRDWAASYHLAVVVDDAAQQITHVVRGEDLRDATYIHHLLQMLLDMPAPTYIHHRLIRDENGKRLAKRHDAMAISAYRAQGMTAQALRDRVC
ncbi:MAG: tRNA glutamyl-Q(34) synthetase GluQRS [Planktomarina sp.]